MDNNIQPRLAYNYAKIKLDSGLCVGCMTFSYEIINDAYIPVPRSSNDFIGKYYNRSNSTWYYDAGFTQIFDISYL